MTDFINKLIGDLEAKKDWKEVQARTKTLPEEYRMVNEEIKNYVWQGGAGVIDPSNLFKRLVELFEAGARDGKQVLEVTGEDVAAFVKELLRGEKTLTENLQENLNKTIAKKLGK